MAGEFLFGVFAGDGTAQMLTVDTKHSTSTISELSPEQKFLFYYRYRQPPELIPLLKTYFTTRWLRLCCGLSWRRG